MTTGNTFNIPHIFEPNHAPSHHHRRFGRSRPRASGWRRTDRWARSLVVTLTAGGGGGAASLLSFTPLSAPPVCSWMEIGRSRSNNNITALLLSSLREVALRRGSVNFCATMLHTSVAHTFTHTFERPPMDVSLSNTRMMGNREIKWWLGFAIN